MPFQISDHPLALQPPRRMTRDSSWLQHTPFVPVLLKLLRPQTFVELGTHAGDSYCAFCDATVALHLDLQCTAVDTWAGDPHAGAYGPEILAELRAYHDPRYRTFSRLLHATFDAALPTFPDGSIDLLHIDGLHTYEAVRHDFHCWRPKLSPRGVVLFHDTTARLPDFGVWRLWEELAATAPSFNFPYGWGLGVLAVGKDVPPAFLDLLGQFHTDPSVAALFQALGQRNELLRNMGSAGQALHACHDMTNQLRRLAGLPPLHATVELQKIVHYPATHGPVVVNDLLHTANDAAGMLQELKNLRTLKAAQTGA
jgi:hypothetical protein